MHSIYFRDQNNPTKAFLVHQLHKYLQLDIVSWTRQDMLWTTGKEQSQPQSLYPFDAYVAFH